MTPVTTHAGASGALEEVVFGPQAAPAPEPEARGEAGVGPAPYDSRLLALGA